VVVSVAGEDLSELTGLRRGTQPLLHEIPSDFLQGKADPCTGLDCSTNVVKVHGLLINGLRGSFNTGMVFVIHNEDTIDDIATDV